MWNCIRGSNTKFHLSCFIIFIEFLDGDLSSWINRERFPTYFQIDSFSLYQMGEQSKHVFLYELIF